MNEQFKKGFAGFGGWIFRSVTLECSRKMTDFFECFLCFRFKTESF